MNLLYIWSKDRPAQLECFLDSCDRNGVLDEFMYEVLYTYSDNSFKAGYELVMKDWGRANFTLEENPKEQFLSSLSKSENICLATDDTFVHSKLPTTVCDKLEDVGVFSLRLGLNTIIQDWSIESYQPILSNYEDEGQTIRWNFSSYPVAGLNWGYPFSIDMHLFKSKVLKALCEDINFRHPPLLESGLVYKRDKINQHIRAFKHSVAVNVPITTAGGSTTTQGLCLKDLNDKFLSGQKLRYKKQDIIGAHQILEIE